MRPIPTASDRMAPAAKATYPWMGMSGPSMVSHMSTANQTAAMRMARRGRKIAALPSHSDHRPPGVIGGALRRVGPVLHGAARYLCRASAEAKLDQSAGAGGVAGEVGDGGVAGV